MSATHYVVRIVIQKVVKEETQSTAGRIQGAPTAKELRVNDIANIVVSADSLERISEKAAAHLALVDSDEEIS